MTNHSTYHNSNVSPKKASQLSNADLYREEILRARNMSPEEKLLEGPRLFDRGCQRLADIIRNHFPNADEATVQAIVDRAVSLVH